MHRVGRGTQRGPVRRAIGNDQRVDGSLSGDRVLRRRAWQIPAIALVIAKLHHPSGRFDESAEAETVCEIISVVSNSRNLCVRRRHFQRDAMIKSTIFALVSLVLGAVASSPASGQALADLIPAGATHCAVSAPPAQAGIAVTPGGFVMVFPRNDALTDRFTGCKLMWVVDVEKMPRMATLYFENGKLAVAVAHDVRDRDGKIVGACALPAAKSLMPKAGRQMTDAACTGFTGDSFYALRLPTWPRSCLKESNAAVCTADPK